MEYTYRRRYYWEIWCLMVVVTAVLGFMVLIAGYEAATGWSPGAHSEPVARWKNVLYLMVFGTGFVGGWAIFLAWFLGRPKEYRLDDSGLLIVGPLGRRLEVPWSDITGVVFAPVPRTWVLGGRLINQFASQSEEVGWDIWTREGRLPISHHVERGTDLVMRVAERLSGSQSPQGRPIGDAPWLKATPSRYKARPHYGPLSLLLLGVLLATTGVYCLYVLEGSAPSHLVWEAIGFGVFDIVVLMGCVVACGHWLRFRATDLETTGEGLNIHRPWRAPELIHWEEIMGLTRLGTTWGGRVCAVLTRAGNRLIRTGVHNWPELASILHSAGEHNRSRVFGVSD